MRRVAQIVGAALATTCAVGMTGAPAVAQTSSAAAKAGAVKVIATGLNGPFQLAEAGGRYLYVAENGAKQITRIDRFTGAKTVVVTGFGEAQPQGVTTVGKLLVIVTGGGEDTSLPSNAASVFVAREGGKPRLIADLYAFEKKRNPDGQKQDDSDSLTNPYYVVPDPVHRDSVIVADAGANDLLRVRLRDGKVTRAKALPLITSGSVCSGVTGNNTADGKGCDPVPTGIAAGPHHTLFVSALGSLIPGEGRIYVLDSRTWKIKRVIRNLDAPTGLALGRHGEIYASEATYGLRGEPGPDTDFSAIGRIVRIDPCRGRTYAKVTQSSGLLVSRGHLYSSAWSIVPGLDGGEVVKVLPSAFTAAS